MARTLRDKDYLRLIQSDNLLQVIETNQSVKLDVEQSAQTEMISYLTQRYDISKVFTNTTVFSLLVAYKANNLVEYTEPEHNTSTAYVIDNRVSYKDKIYKCILASTGFLPTNTTYWQYVVEDKSLFYLSLPHPEYNPKSVYALNTIVWYNDIVYTCISTCTGIAPTNTNHWLAGATYTVNVVLPTDTTKWTAGDNRNQQIVLYLIDITLYHLHSRINPRLIPDLRKERYDGNGQHQSGGAIGWLKRCASGDVTADLPNKSPQQGISIRWGSLNKSNNYI